LRFAAVFRFAVFLAAFFATFRFAVFLAAFFFAGMMFEIEIITFLNSTALFSSKEQCIENVAYVHYEL
jgi:hypothetical protein